MFDIFNIIDITNTIQLKIIKYTQQQKSNGYAQYLILFLSTNDLP